MKPTFFALVGLVYLLSAFESNASCGVGLCPVHHGEGEQSSLAAHLYTRYSSFDLPGGEGSYFEAMPAVAFTHKAYHAMLHVPVAALFTDDNTIGLGNPMILAEYRLAWSQWALAMGTQLELPLGDHESGLASDHWMALPYATIRFNQDPRFFFASTLGMSTVVGSHHEPGATNTPVKPVFVNPHGEREIVYRLMAGLRSTKNPNTGTLETYWQGQWVISHDEEGAHYGQVGLRGAYPITSMLGLTGFSEFHGTNPSRYEWRVGLGFDFRPIGH